MHPDEFRALAAWVESGRQDWLTSAGTERLKQAAEAGFFEEADIFLPALRLIRTQDPALWEAAEFYAPPHDLARIIQAFSSPLALFTIANCLLPRVSAELLLTTARRLLLLDFFEGEPDEAQRESRLDFVTALAQQNWSNEYCYFMEADEARYVPMLEDWVRTSVGEGIDPYALAVLACYVPPLSVCAPENLLPLGAIPKLKGLIERTVTERLQERELAQQMPRLTAIENPTSRVVRQMYEENPYPRWRIGRRANPPVPIAEAQLGLFPTMDKAAFGNPPQPRALLGGCGTGQNVLGFWNLSGGAEVTAIDLSLASLSYAKRSTDRLGLDVKYGHADIMALDGRLGKFDVIEVSGVLQAMADPVAGWRILLSHLRPGGIMRIGLYSTAQRVSVRDAWVFARELGVKGDPAGIRRFRREVINEAWLYGKSRPSFLPDAPSYLLFLNGLDFYSTSGCRDLVFHVQEVQHTIAEIMAIVRDFGLKFLTIHFGNPRDRQKYAELFPEDPHRVSPECLMKFEQKHPDAFAQMINFGVQKPLN